MPTWKVLLICALACACMGLATATVAIPMAQDGNQKWVWLAGLLGGTIVAGTLLTVLMKSAGNSLDLKPRGSRR
jgi:hypothetical protein